MEVSCPKDFEANYTSLQNRFHRAMTRPYFARDRVTDFELFDKHSEIVVAKLKERFSQGEAVDFQACVYILTDTPFS